MDMQFFKNKKILVTGHTGFKGSWLCSILSEAGADVAGYSLKAPTDPNLFGILDLDKEIKTVYGDIRDFDLLKRTFDETKPEFVIHLAAQPIVRESYQNPRYTYDVNVMGTVNVLECVRQSGHVKSVLNVTTDKVYKNKEWEWGYRENDELNGYDPYSNSKSCSELVTDSYKNSFLMHDGIAVSTARAGNVIGGGDFAKDRIIPDCIRAALEHRSIQVRNPYSVRPYEHVLEPLSAYLEIVKRQYENSNLQGSYNIGPDEGSCVETGDLVTMFCESWGRISGEKIEWINQHDGGPHEANYLKLDCSRIRKVIGWKPAWGIEKAVEATVEWAWVYANGQDIKRITSEQIKRYGK